MRSTNSNALIIIRETAHKFIPESKVLLFGSRARSDYNHDSDYDFLVITKENFDIRKKRNLKSLIRKELAKFKIPADILIQSAEEVYYKKDIPGHIVNQVLQEGVAL
ncbi:MAG: nucleotidyltransferase domain-containing protein [Bacteroidota bacterium]